MPARANLKANPFIRGLLLGRLYERGCDITTQLVRERFGVSRATAKRDLRLMRMAGAVRTRVVNGSATRDDG